MNRHLYLHCIGRTIVHISPQPHTQNSKESLAALKNVKFTNRAN